jgi:RHS repeat-associated protein
MATSTGPDGETNADGSAQIGTETQATTSLGLPNCNSDYSAAESASCQDEPGPAPATHGQMITPPSSIPADGDGWTLYDNLGNDLYTTVGVYPPGGGTPVAQTTYQLFNGNSVTLPGTDTAITCAANAPSLTLPCATIDAAGNVTQLGYDSEGDLVSSSTLDGNGSQVATTTYTYDTDGDMLAQTAPDGNLAGANAADYTTTTAYNADGLETSVTQGGSGGTVPPRTTRYGYDPDGNQTTAEDARGYTTTTTYNADDEPTMVTDPDGNSTLTCYDGNGNVAQTVPPAGVAANSLTPADCPASYPADYDPTRASDWLAPDATLDTYNGIGENTAEYTPLPAGQTGPPDYETTTSTYDSNGNLLQTIAPPDTEGGQPQATTYTYNAAGELATQTAGTSSAASTTSYCYDPTGDLTSVMYGDGNASSVPPCESSTPWIVSPTLYPSQAQYQTTYSYDSADDLVSVTRPGGSTWTYSYDSDGDLVSSTDPDGITATTTYAPGGQTASVTYSGSSAHPESYSYDADGNMTGMTDASGTSSFVYDPFGEELSATNGAGQTTSWTYNSDGDVTSTTYPLPASASWATTDTVDESYDNADNLTGVTDFNGNRISIAYSSDGLVDAMTLGVTGDKIDTTFDNTDSPSLIKLKNSTATLQSFSYSYGPDGTVLNETDTPTSSFSPATYTYDDQGRVTSMTPGSGTTLNYTYDASSNLTTLPGGGTGTYNASGELSSASIGGAGTSFTYDPDGQQLNEKQGPTTVTSGSWDGANGLTSYDDSSADMSSAVYDGNGMRASTTITAAGGSPVTADYVWDGDDLLMDSTNAYIYAGGTAPAEQVSLASGAVTYLSTDALGSVRGTVNSSGTLTGSTSYDAWGNPEIAGGLTSITPFGYAGGYTDPTGLIYLDDRYYDPGIGQFTSLDPDVDDTGDPYGYADSDPVSATDPTGDSPGSRPCECGTDYPSERFYYAEKFIYYEIRHTIKNGDYYQHVLVPLVEGCELGVSCLLAIGSWWNRVHRGGNWDWKVELGRKKGALCGRCGTHDIDDVAGQTVRGKGGELDWYSRVTTDKQIFYNVWANIFFAYVGLSAGFPQKVLVEGAAESQLVGTGENTPGNRIERQMGYDLFHRHPNVDNLKESYITYAISSQINRFDRHCDVLPFPATHHLWEQRNCYDYHA